MLYYYERCVNFCAQNMWCSWMRIKVAFFKGKGNWINKIVRWWTKSPYSHAELVMSDNETWISISPFLTSKLDAIRKESYIIDNWDIIEIDVTQEQHEALLEFYSETKGSSYDWFGMLLSQFFPLKIKRYKRWYCSEWILYALRISCIVDWKIIKIFDQSDLSPSKLGE